MQERKEKFDTENKKQNVCSEKLIETKKHNENFRGTK